MARSCRRSEQPASRKISSCCICCGACLESDASRGRAGSGLERSRSHTREGAGDRRRAGAVFRPELAQRLTGMTSDEWQAHVTREAAKAIGKWLMDAEGFISPSRP